MNVRGFMNRKNDLHPFIFEQSVHTGVVIAHRYGLKESAPDFDDLSS